MLCIRCATGDSFRDNLGLAFVLLVNEGMFDRDPKPENPAPKLVLVREATRVMGVLKVRTSLRTGGKVTSAACDTSPQN